MDRIRNLSATVLRFFANLFLCGVERWMNFARPRAAAWKTPDSPYDPSNEADVERADKQIVPWISKVIADIIGGIAMLIGLACLFVFIHTTLTQLHHLDQEVNKLPERDIARRDEVVELKKEIEALKLADAQQVEDKRVADEKVQELKKKFESPWMRALAQQDSDGDSIVDAEDACPRNAGDRKDGCPTVDSDGDKIPDHIDTCPAEGGTVYGVWDPDARGYCYSEGVPTDFEECKKQGNGCPYDIAAWYPRPEAPAKGTPHTGRVDIGKDGGSSLDCAYTLNETDTDYADLSDCTLLH